MRTRYPHQAGMTLIEIMIAITISLILLAGVMQIFIGNKQTYRVQDAVARLQESGRFAMKFITKDVRMAGFMGCASIDSGIAPTNMADLDGDGVPDAAANFSGDGLEAWEQTDLPASVTDELTAAGLTVLAGTDIIRIKRGSDTGVRLTGNTSPTNANIQIDPATGAGMFAADDIIFITDCTHADIFAATSASGGAGILTVAHSNSANTGNFITPYSTDAEVMRMVNTTYFIANNAAGVPSLFRLEMGNNAIMTAQELVEGVEDMELLYGEDTDGDRTANRYVSADFAGLNMQQVVSTRITMTIRTIEDNISTVTNNGDKRLRRNFTTTVAIRNRVT